MRVVLLGPPGAGKGTQGHVLAERYGAELVSTGNIFRVHVQNDTDLGREAKSFMEAGELVPDELVVRMVLDTLRDREAFILDGFPRNCPQAQALEEALSSWDRPLTAALAFEVDDETVVKRMAGRRTCQRCQRSYNVELKPPRQENRCDVCGGELVQRNDDEEATVRRRIELYHQTTSALLDFYESRGLLRRIDADGTEREVARRVVEALGVPVTP